MNNTYYTMTICGHERHLPICRLTEELCIAGFVIFGDPELTDDAAAALLERVPDFDIIVTAESKGIPLAHEMARQCNYSKYVVLRKEAKLYMRDVISTEVDSITTDHIQTLCIGKDDADLISGKRVLIVDDVISTGESLKSIEELVNQVGGNIVGRAFILAEGDAAKRDDVIFLDRLPLFNRDGEPID